MSRRHTVQDATGVIVEKMPLGTLIVTQPGTPSAQGFTSANGFAIGCLYINTSGTIGSLLYINSGSATSATWTNIA